MELNKRCYYPHFGIPFLSLENYELNKQIVKLIPEAMARRLQILAIDKFDKILTVGMVNPQNIKALEELEQYLNMVILRFKVDIQEWANAVNNNYLKEENIINEKLLDDRN